MKKKTAFEQFLSLLLLFHFSKKEKKKKGRTKDSFVRAIFSCQMTATLTKTINRFRLQYLHEQH